jgi:multidrug efflux pump subunit AcrA (membrane-fusion protein)
MSGLKAAAVCVVGAVVLVGAVLADNAATRPATTEALAASRPSTQAVERGYVVKRGDLSVEIAGEGVLLPSEAYELKLKMKAYGGPLTIAAIAPSGPVRKGDLLLELEQTHLKWALEGAENDLATAAASLKKAEADAELAGKSEALALRIQDDAVENAVAGKKWWDEVDGPQMLLSADLTVKKQKDSIEDQEQELDQLHKMYKSEELTNATADIVIKRAVRQLDLSKVYLKMQEDRCDKSKTFDYGIAKQKVIDGVEQAKQQLTALKIAQELAGVQRKASLASARIAVEQAQRKLDELKADAGLFSVKSPADGVVVYGQLTDGAWQGGEAKSLKAGERLAAGGVVLRVIAPGKMRMEIGISELQAFWVEDGVRAKVTPAALPQMTYDATCGGPVAMPRGNPPTFGFMLPVTLPDVDGRLMPGMKANVKVEGMKLKDVLLVPLSAVSEGQVTVKGKNGKPEKRTVTLGRTDGKMVEVKGGVGEGEELAAKK